MCAGTRAAAAAAVVVVAAAALLRSRNGAVQASVRSTTDRRRWYGGALKVVKLFPVSSLGGATLKLDGDALGRMSNSTEEGWVSEKVGWLFKGKGKLLRARQGRQRNSSFCTRKTKPSKAALLAAGVEKKA
jgi:hypothetical protein